MTNKPNFSHYPEDTELWTIFAARSSTMTFLLSEALFDAISLLQEGYSLPWILKILLNRPNIKRDEAYIIMYAVQEVRIGDRS